MDPCSVNAQGEISLRKIWLTNDELDRFGSLAMGFHGLIRLIDAESFDEATGANQILRMVYRDFARLIAEIRERVDAPQSWRISPRRR